MYKAIIANQNPILLSNNFESLNSPNRNTNTVLFSGNSDTILASVSYITPKLTSLIHKHTRLIDNDKRRIKKGYYFCKYCEPLDPKGCYPLTRGLKLHLKREHDINWIIAKNKSYITLRDYIEDLVQQLYKSLLEKGGVKGLKGKVLRYTVEKDLIKQTLVDLIII